MAAERQVAGSSSGGRGGGSGSAGGGGAGSMAVLEDNKENEKPKSGDLGDSLGLEILQIVKESQQQHGLRHGDFQRYRGYCSRRLRRLRKTLNFKMGNRHKFTGKKVTEELLSDNRYLLLILMDAERAWSYAMQLKQEANTEPRKRFHLLSRLRKAVKHAEELEHLCESSRVDAKTKLEAQAYTAYLTGMLRFEHQEWKAAMEAFNKCKTIYEKLASAFTEEQAILYNQRVEEISPNIRYCAYNIGDQSAISELMQMRLRTGGTEGLLAEKLESLITQTRAKQAATMSEVEWRGRTVPVKIDKVRIFLLGLADTEAAIAQAEEEETKERLFESLLSECRDAIQAVREELKPDQKQRDHSLEIDSGKVTNIQYLHSYLTYIKLSTAIKRNESMAKALQKALLRQQQPEEDGKRIPRPQDLIRLYDIILQNLAELPQLPGLEEDKSYVKEIAIKTLVYKAYRCFFIAQSYVLVKKWSEALVLYDRVLKYATEVQAQAGTNKNNLKELPDVQDLITQVNAEKYSLQAAAILDAGDSHEAESPSQVKDGKEQQPEHTHAFLQEPSRYQEQGVSKDNTKMFKGVGKGSPSGSSPNKGSPVKQFKSSSSNELAVLISRMQKNADQVEKDILETQSKLKKDVSNQQQNKPLEFQQPNAKNLKEAEILLKDLFLDIDKVKHLKHPQAFEIEKDIKQLHDRMTRQCAEYRELYEKFTLPEAGPKVDWAKILEQKQEQVNGAKYGPTMPELEKQIAEHNILQKEIEAYGLQVKNLHSLEAGDLKAQYKDLLKASIWRGQSLNSLYTHLQGCMKELAYLTEQQRKILRQDWSDQMIDPQSVRREYEDFRSNELLNQEEYVNTLQDDGERMIELKHPAVTPIQAHQEALKNEWQNFLNLCICQEHHLKSTENYRKFYDDADAVSQSLNKLNNDLDNKYSKFNEDNLGIVPDLMCHLENDEKTVKQAEKSIAELKRRSKEISPLKMRRVQCSQPIIMDAICDWDLGDVQLERGEKYTLNNNSNQENWVVQNAKEESKMAPAVCFSIPPPDLEAIDRVNRLEGELNTVKEKRALIQATLRSSNKESVKPSHHAAVKTFTEIQDDSQTNHLLHKLNKIDNDLGQIKMDIFSRTRSPLNHGDPIEDVTQRIRDQEGTKRRIQVIGAEKEAAQKACETYLSKKLTGISASQIPVMLNNIKNKYNDVKVLSRLYDEKAKASINLESQMENTDRIISTFEAKLSHDGTIPASPNALQDRANELQKLKRDLVKQENCLLMLNRSLKDAEHSCSAVQNNFQEYCPDLPRQKKEVQLINDRYHIVADQLDQREKTLWNTSLIYQQFQNANENLIFWLNSLPKYQIKTTDGLSQINYKLQAQKRLSDEIQSKESDKNSVINLSRNVQSVLNDYELQAGKYRSSLDPALTASSVKCLRVTPLQESIQAQENDMTKLYAETAAENKQQLSWLEFAKKIMDKKEVNDAVQVMHEQTQQSKNTGESQTESEILKSQLKEEQSKKANVQQELEEQRNKLLILKTQRPIERVEEKEVIEYYRDPVLESDLTKISNQIENEKKKREDLQADIEIMNNKVLEMEKDGKVVKSQLLTKEVTKIERDPNLDAQAARLQEEIRHLRENSTSFSEIEWLRKELHLLEQKQPNIREKVVVKEVIKLEKDPEMLKAIRTLQMQIDEDSFKKKSVMDTIGKLKSKIEDLEQVIEAAEPKVIVKEIKQVEQDPELLKESSTLQKLIDEERNKNMLLASELTQLQSKYSTVEKQKPKVEVKERVNEIFHLDPETEEEIVRLKRELQEASRKRKKVDQEVETALTELKVLRSQTPTVEFKEVIQEVMKTEKSPEILREIDRLKEQLNDLVNANGRSQEQLIRLQGERDEWERERSKVETKVVTKEVVRYENDPLLEKEAECLRQEVRNILQKRRATEDAIYDLQNKYMLLERRKPEEKVVVQEVVVTQKDAKLRDEHNRLSRSLDEEISNRRRMEHEVQQLRASVEDKEKLLNFQDDRNKRLALEKEMRQITLRIKEIEESPIPVQEKIIMEELVKLEKDPVLEQSSTNLRVELDNEKAQVLSLQRECKNLQIQIDVLQKTKSQEKTIYKEVIRVEKDRVLENERARLWDLLSRERTSRQNAEEDIRHLKEKIEKAEGMKHTWTREEVDLQKIRNLTMQEKASLEDELRELERQKQQKILFLREQTKLLSQRTESDRQKKIQFGQEVSRLESDILMEKDNIYEKERTIRELQSRINREELNNETQMRETNLSTKISILDPETGKDMSPYEAYKRCMIDRSQYIHLQELECDWEEITTLGPEGDVSVLLDKKSGKQYSIDDALRFRRITKEEYQLYKEGKIPISEFALLVAGETKQNSPLSIGSIISKSPISSPVFQQKQSFFSPGPHMVFCDDTFPIAGVYDTTYDNKYNIKSALGKKLVDPMTAQKLLEAQAATGGIVDLISQDRYSVHKALDKGLIDNTYLQRLLNAQKAFTGIEDPVTKRRLAVGEAVQKGWITKDNAFPYLQVQHLTGGLIDPKKTGRIPVSEAVQTGLISSDLATLLQDESSYEKDLVDPITKEKIHYKEAMALCQKDPLSGLLLLPATSEGYQSTILSTSLPRFRH